MARKLLKHHQDDLRAKIQADKLIRMLHEAADGTKEMNQTRVQAAKILLDKSLSNATQEVALTGSISVEWGLGRSAREA